MTICICLDESGDQRNLHKRIIRKMYKKFKWNTKEEKKWSQMSLSTYETNTRRTEERSTVAHNSVEIMNESSSEVWGGFRVADRARVTEINESEEKIVATHDGYMKKFAVLHTREWIFEENKIIIKDSLNKKVPAVARLHFHPSVTEEMIQKHITINQTTNHQLQITNYQYAPEFNRHMDALVLEIPFEKELTVEILAK